MSFPPFFFFLVMTSQNHVNKKNPLFSSVFEEKESHQGQEMEGKWDKTVTLILNVCNTT